MKKCSKTVIFVVDDEWNVHIISDHQLQPFHVFTIHNMSTQIIHHLVWFQIVSIHIVIAMIHRRCFVFLFFFVQKSSFLCIFGMSLIEMGRFFVCIWNFRLPPQWLNPQTIGTYQSYQSQNFSYGSQLAPPMQPINNFTSLTNNIGEDNFLFEKERFKWRLFCSIEWHGKL